MTEPWDPSPQPRPPQGFPGYGPGGGGPGWGSPGMPPPKPGMSTGAVIAIVLGTISLLGVLLVVGFIVVVGSVVRTASESFPSFPPLPSLSAAPSGAPTAPALEDPSASAQAPGADRVIGRVFSSDKGRYQVRNGSATGDTDETAEQIRIPIAGSEPLDITFEVSERRTGQGCGVVEDEGCVSHEEALLTSADGRDAIRVVVVAMDSPAAAAALETRDPGLSSGPEESHIAIRIAEDPYVVIISLQGPPTPQSRSLARGAQLLATDAVLATRFG